MLNSNLDKVGVVVLAAGKGTRLNCIDKPKVMLEIGGRPIISYITETLKKIGFQNSQIMLVVGFFREKVKEFLQNEVLYADQNEQKGTAHAAFTGSQMLSPEADNILVINGDDSAFYTQETLLNFINEHLSAQATVSVLSAEIDDPSALGRIVRHDDGKVEIIEKEYLTDEQKKIKEISTGTFCFDRKWFENMFPSMPPLRKLGEYGLPTALAVADNENKKIQVVKLKNSNEWFGINTPAELEEADKRKRAVL